MVRLDGRKVLEWQKVVNQFAKDDMSICELNIHKLKGINHVGVS